MSTLQTEVDILRKKLVEKEVIIEQQRREAKEKEELSWKFNLQVIKDLANQETKTANAAFASITPSTHNINNAKACNRSIRRAQIIAPFMQSVFNCLQRLEDHIKKMELKQIVSL